MDVITTTKYQPTITTSIRYYIGKLGARGCVITTTKYQPTITTSICYYIGRLGARGCDDGYDAGACALPDICALALGYRAYISDKTLLPVL